MKLDGIELNPDHVGLRVVYNPVQSLREAGTITSWNDMFIFVRYDGDTHNKATHPTTIRFTKKSLSKLLLQQI